MIRLPINHLHRAFPELDPYSDEQCHRFVRAARGSVQRRALTGSIIAIVASVVTAAGIAGAWYVIMHVLQPYRTLNIAHANITWYGWLLNISIGILGVAVGPMVGYLVRDFLLIRLVRHILRTRGVCMGCRYSLVGLFVGGDLNVTCPECGTQTVVDPALGELVTDEAGRARFKPDESRHRASSFWTERRVRRMKRSVPWLALTFVGLPLLIAGGYEGFIRWQASVARSERTGLQTINDGMLERALRVARAGDSNAWDAFIHAAMQRDEIDRAIWRNSTSGRTWPQFWLIYAAPPQYGPETEPDPDIEEQNRLGREVALELMDAYGRAGLFQTLDAMAASPLALRLIESPPDAPLIGVSLPEVGECRTLAFVSAARAHLAARANDPEEFAAALESGLALARLMDSRAFAIEFQTAATIEGLMLDRLFDALSRPASRDWVEAMAEALERQLPGEPDPDLPWFEAERVSTLDTVAWAFSDPDRVRLGRWSSGLVPLHRSKRSEIDPLGTYNQNKRAFNRLFDSVRAYAAQPIPKRYITDYSNASHEPDLLLVNALFPNLRWAINDHEQRVVRRRAARTMIAIERYRLAYDRYPEELSDLVPEFLDALLIDPWSMGPFCYRRIDSNADPFGRGYLIYSPGIDLIDNGGTPPAQRFRESVLGAHISSQARDVDYIFNEPVSRE